MPFNTNNLFRRGRLIKRCVQPHHLRRTLTIALIVGSFLTLINQGGLLLAGQVSSGLLLKALLNYLTPFVVANLGLLSPAGKGESATSAGSDSPSPSKHGKENR